MELSDQKFDEMMEAQTRLIREKKELVDEIEDLKDDLVSRHAHAIQFRDCTARVLRAYAFLRAECAIPVFSHSAAPMYHRRQCIGRVGVCVGFGVEPRQSIDRAGVCVCVCRRKAVLTRRVLTEWRRRRKSCRKRSPR